MSTGFKSLALSVAILAIFKKGIPGTRSWLLIPLLLGTTLGVFAQSMVTLKAGESLTVAEGEVLYVVSAQQSNTSGTPVNIFTATVQIGADQASVAWNPFSISSSGYGPAVLAGPATLNVKSDSAITYLKLRETDLQSVVIGPSLPLTINVASNIVATVYPPLSQEPLVAYVGSKIEAGGMTLTNIFLSPPTQLAGPMKITLGSSKPTVATFQLSPSQTNLIGLAAGRQSITVEGSTDLVQWLPVFSTNSFQTTQGFFRIRARN